MQHYTFCLIFQSWAIHTGSGDISLHTLIFVRGASGWNNEGFERCDLRKANILKRCLHRSPACNFCKFLSEINTEREGHHNISKFLLQSKFLAILSDFNFWKWEKAQFFKIKFPSLYQKDKIRLRASPHEILRYLALYSARWWPIQSTSACRGGRGCCLSNM